MSRVKIPEESLNLAARSYALQLVLAVGEENYDEFRRLAVEVGNSHGGDEFASRVVLTMTMMTASALKHADPDAWSARLRLALYEIDLDPSTWVKKH